MLNNSKKPKFKISEIKKNIQELDSTYTHERKVQFLLDIRGYLIINKIKGNYVEYGSFLSEMQVASFYVLENTNNITNYIGIDFFKKFLSHQINNFYVDYEKTKKKLKKISTKLKIIKLDLANQKNLKKIDYQISVAVIDCNEKKSLINSLKNSIKNMVNGGIIYIDDFFIVDKNNLLLKPTLEKSLNRYKKKLEFFKSYPPFGKAYIILNK
jgi:hypothetical protein